MVIFIVIALYQWRGNSARWLQDCTTDRVSWRLPPRSGVCQLDRRERGPKKLPNCLTRSPVLASKSPDVVQPNPPPVQYSISSPQESPATIRRSKRKQLASPEPIDVGVRSSKRRKVVGSVKNPAQIESPDILSSGLNNQAPPKRRMWPKKWLPTFLNVFLCIGFWIWRINMIKSTSIFSPIVYWLSCKETDSPIWCNLFFIWCSCMTVTIQIIDAIILIGTRMIKLQKYS